MGAEPDLSPVPEPTMSPEPDIRGHDNQQPQDWKADMMSALGGSVSFGRFLSEPLDWGKWSAFEHNRYLEEAAWQARPGSVAQKRALLEAHYARKRKVEAEAHADAHAGPEHDGEVVDEDAGGAASLSSSAAGSSCMTDDDAAAARQEEVCGGGAGDHDDVAAVEYGSAGGALVRVTMKPVEAITNGVDSACKMDETADPPLNRDVGVNDVLQTKEKPVSSSGHLVVMVDAVERQPLKDTSDVNKEVTDSAKKRRLQMPSLFQKPSSKLSSPCPSSGKKGESSSTKRRSVECGALAGVAVEAVEAITSSIGSPCRMDEAADETRERDSDVLPAKENQELCNGHFVVTVDAVERQPLKETSVVNQDFTDSAKKRRLQMPSLFQKSGKLSSPCPSSQNKGQSSSAKRRSVAHSSKGNASPPSTDCSKPSASSALKKRSTLSALHMSMSFSRCESGTTASSSRNLGTTIAERISQLQSASRPVENTQPKEFRPSRKASCGALSEVEPRVSQMGEQRSSHVMSIKQKLFGSTSPSMPQNPRSIREKQRKPDNEQLREPRQHFCFKTGPLSNFCWKNKQAKDSSRQNAEEIPHLPNSSHLIRDVNHKQQMGKGVSKEKQICCFPIRKLH